MFGRGVDKSKGLLFCTHDLDQSLRGTADEIRREVESLTPDRLLNTAPEDLKNYLATKHRVAPISLLRDEWYADHRETQVDVRYDSNRWISDKSRPFMVPGERIEVRVPFQGDAELFYAKPNTSTLNPPRAVIDKNELVLRYDILLREGERNVFIVECKFWKGPKAFRDAIDQLLSYSTWRDGKTAILVFNRGTETSTVLAGADSTAKAHANFKRTLDWPHESGFRYVFHANGDTNRELILTILVFHVPK